MKKIRITQCRFCGGTEFITAYQSGYARVQSAESFMKTANLYHTICRDCGSVLRSFVKEPEKLLKKSERRQEGES